MYTGLRRAAARLAWNYIRKPLKTHEFGLSASALRDEELRRMNDDEHETNLFTRRSSSSRKAEAGKPKQRVRPTDRYRAGKDVVPSKNVPAASQPVVPLWRDERT
jgi:hypothetical protein